MIQYRPEGKMIGRTVSYYKILAKLGEGGMGVVYKARDTKLDRTVALKFLPSHVGADENEKQRFLNEAKAASALDHSNICAIHSIEESSDGKLFIVMAYYEGMSLKEKIEQAPLPLKDVVNYSIQIASGLQKAHEKGIVHRDLKPANIFITNDDQIKIIDFGLARVAERTLLTKSGTTLGTVPYMSPEQAQGAKVDHRTDIWSLGVVIYEMISGQRPFKSEYETALVYSIINEDPEPVTGVRSGIPMELERIVNKCLEKDPNDRYQHTDEMIVDLRKVKKELSSGIRTRISQTEIENEISPQSGNRTKPASFQRVKLLGFGIAVLLILVGLYYFILQPGAGTEIDRSIAVLSFENLSPDPNDAIFADGVHEDIIIQLAGLSDVRVIARSSVLRYRDERRDLQQIARDLNVSTILEGSVRRDRDIIRVAVQLVDPFKNQTLWAHSYERSMTGIFEIQQAIAGEIASALKARLTPAERERLEQRPTEVLEAYELYLRGRDYHSRPGLLEENYRTANSLLHRAIEYDPQFAQAYALLSQTYSSLVWFGYDASPQMIERSKRNAERAMQLQPDLAESHIAMGYYYYHSLREYNNAIEHLNKASQLQPSNAEIYAAISFVKRRLGQFDRAVDELKKAISLDPVNDRYYAIMSELYTVLRRYEEAHTIGDRILTLSPDDHYARFVYLGNHISWKGDGEFVRKNFRDHPQMKREHPFHSLELQYQIRDFEGMIRSVNDVPDRIYKTWVGLRPASYFLALAYLSLQEYEKSRHYYEEALSVMKELSPEFHDEPRYRMGLARIYAGLGLQEEAVKEGKKAVELMPISLDAYWGTRYEVELAYVYSRLSKPKEAVDILKRLLNIPSHLSIPRLRIDPSWDPIRDTPEFQDLLRESEERMS